MSPTQVAAASAQAADPAPFAVSLRGVSKVFPVRGGGETVALQDIDLEIAPRRRYVDRFYLVDLKRDFYRAHGHNRAILLVSQDRQELELDIRSADGWTSDTLSGPQALLTLPDFGLTCRLHEIYKNTPVGPL